MIKPGDDRPSDGGGELQLTPPLEAVLGVEELPAAEGEIDEWAVARAAVEAANGGAASQPGTLMPPPQADAVGAQSPAFALEETVEVRHPSPFPLADRVRLPTADVLIIDDEGAMMPTEPLSSDDAAAEARATDAADIIEDILEIEETAPLSNPIPAAPPALPSEPPRLAPPPVPVVAQTMPVGAVPPAPVEARTPDGVAIPILPPGAAWPEALSQRPRKKRLKPWFEEVFDEDYLRTLPFMTAEQTLREVGFIRDALSPPTDGQLLDVACGYGRHAIELGQRGLRVTGIDLSLALLIRAADESQRRGLSVNFVHADMREMTFEGQFDGAYSMLTSFGYFDEETNLKVVMSICRALKPGGRFLIDVINRDYVAADLPTRVWWEGDGCVVLEEVDFNFHTSRMNVRRSVVFQDGRQLEHDISIRAYSLHELGKLLRQAGFRVLEVSGSLAARGRFFGSTSRNIIMVCERPTS